MGRSFQLFGSVFEDMQASGAVPAWQSVCRSRAWLVCSLCCGRARTRRAAAQCGHRSGILYLMHDTRRMKRVEAPNHIRFLTFSCYRRLPLFTNDRIKAAFRDHLERTRDDLGFHLHAWVMMPEHLHLLIWPDVDRADVSRICWQLKRPFAKEVIARWRELRAPILERLLTADGTHRFWQHGGGFDRNIYSQEVLQVKLDYIHCNPVERGLASNPIDYPWSSARWYSGICEGQISMNLFQKPDSNQ